MALFHKAEIRRPFSVIPAHPPHGFGRIRPSAEAGIQIVFVFRGFRLSLAYASSAGMTSKNV